MLRLFGWASDGGGDAEAANASKVEGEDGQEHSDDQNDDHIDRWKENDDHFDATAEKDDDFQAQEKKRGMPLPVEEDERDGHESDVVDREIKSTQEEKCGEKCNGEHEQQDDGDICEAEGNFVEKDESRVEADFDGTASGGMAGEFGVVGDLAELTVMGTQRQNNNGSIISLGEEDVIDGDGDGDDDGSKNPMASRPDDNEQSAIDEKIAGEKIAEDSGSSLDGAGNGDDDGSKNQMTLRPDVDKQSATDEKIAGDINAGSSLTQGENADESWFASDDDNDDAKKRTATSPQSRTMVRIVDGIHGSVAGDTKSPAAEISSTSPSKAPSDEDEEAAGPIQEHDEVDDIFPKARDFLVDMSTDDAITLATRAASIVQGFNDYSDGDAGGGGDNDTKTIATNRTNATRVQPVSAAFRTAMAQKEEAAKGSAERHPHQSIFDILDRNFKDLGDGGIDGGCSRKIGYKDVKLCFAAFVAVFSLPPEPVFAKQEDFHLAGNDSSVGEEGSQYSNDDHEPRLEATNGGANCPPQEDRKESALQKVPLSVAFALWGQVLNFTGIGKGKNANVEDLSYIRSTLVLLGLLDLASIERDRDDGVLAATSMVSSLGNHSNQGSIECLVIHDPLHQQYGEYLAWGDHDMAFRSLISEEGRRWNEAVMAESKLIGSNQYALRMLPLSTMRAHRMQDAFDILNEKTFVRRRLRVLGPSGAAKAHMGDVDELLCLIEKQMERRGGVDAMAASVVEPIDEQEQVLGAYRQMLKYCLHEVEELSKPHTDEDGNVKLGKTAMYKTADVGNALHLLGASLGGYGFFDEEMEYYEEALRLKTLAVHGDIEGSVTASDTLHNMGFSFDNAGKRDEALECYDRALDIRYACLGDDDLRVAETLHNKGALLCEEDRADEALECLEEALRIRELHYGEEHESCADTMQWMGNLLRKNGDAANALDYFKFALSIKQKRLGADDIDVANTLFNTAVLLDDIEKHDLSLVAYKEALRIRILVLGSNNQEVADTLFCMGNVATAVEKHDEALGYYQESIKIREAMVQDDDPSAEELEDSLLFLFNPRSPCPDILSQYEQLNPCYEEVLPLKKLILGSDHPDIFYLLTRMGDIYFRLHDYDNAIGSFQGALRVKRANSPGGEDDSEVATTLVKKGEAHLYKTEFERAKTTFDLAVRLQEKLCGAGSMPVASSTYRLGVAYYYLNDFSRAKLLFRECMRIQIRHDACVVLSLCWIGKQQEKLNEPEKALERYLSALRMYKKGKSSIDYRVVATLLHAIGKLYEDDKVNLQDMSLKCYSEEIGLIHSKLDVEEEQITRMLADAHFHAGMLNKRREGTEKAIEHLEKALGLTTQCDGESSIRVALITDSLGMLYASTSQEDFTAAKKHYSTAYSVYEKSVGRDDLRTSDCAFRLGGVLEGLKSNLSLDFYKESLRVRRLNMDEDDEKVGDLLFCSGRVFLSQCNYGDAAKSFEEALGIRKRLLGDCSAVANTYHNLGKTYSGITQNEKALIFYRESVRINKKLGEKKALFQVSLDMAQCATVCSHFQLAIDCYNDCLQGAESLDNKGAETALVLQKMGEIQMNELHKYDDATKGLLDALEILRGLENEGNGEPQNMMDLVLLIAQAFALAKDYNNSLDYYEEHIGLLESSTPENEELIADSLFEMGNVFADMDEPDYELAIEKIVDCLDTKKKIFGSDDERVAHVVHTLATVYEKAGQHDKAINALAEALHTFKLKQNKAGSVKVYHALGRMKASKAAELNSTPGDLIAALECYKEALKIRRQIMSLDDIELASILYEYSILLILHEEHAPALPLLEEALRIQKSKSGLKDERVAKTLLRIAEVHVRLKKYDSSLVCLEQVLLIQSSLDDDGGIDLDLGSCYYFLGTTHLARGDFQKAITSYLECMKAKEWETKQLATIHNELGIAYGKVNEFDKAIESFVQTLRIRKTELGNNSLDYGHSVYNLAEIQLANEKHDQALNCLSEAIRVYKLFPDEMNEKIAAALELKGDTFSSLNDHRAVVSVLQECIELLNSLESSEDDESSQACNEQAARVNYKMGLAHAKIGEYEEAFDSYREAIGMFITLLGKDDLRVGEVMYDVGQLIVSQGGDDICEKSNDFFSEVIRIFSLHGKEKDTKVADALYQKSTLLADCAEYDEASSLLDEALAVYRESLNGDAVEIGKAMLLCGRLHHAQGKNNDAMAAFEEALRIFQSSLGEDDINVSLALSNIGIIHARKLEYPEAVAKCKMALKIRVIRGEQDQDVADSVFNIANILNDWGKEDEAHQYFQQSLKLYIHLLGEEDISVANCLHKLAVIYWNRGDIDEALQSFHDALAICEQEDENDVVSMLTSIYRGIGNCYYNKGDDDDALENFAKCLRMQKIEFGDDCVEMTEPCDSIGLIYQKKQKYEEAMNFHSKALMINESHHGKGSQECAYSDFQIAKVLLASDKYEECITRFRNHLETYYGGSDDSKEVAEVYHLLGITQSKLTEYEESVISLNKALSIRQKLWGKTHLKVAETMLDLGKVLEEYGDSDEAITAYDQAITIFREIPDGDFRAIANAYSKLGALFEKSGNCEASLHAWKKALKIYNSNSGSDSITVGETLFHIGKIYDELENYDKSAGCFSEAVKIIRSKMEDNEMIGQALGYIGRNYARKKQYAKAVELSTESLRLQKQFADAGTIAESLVKLGNILNAWGKTNQAMQFFEEALRLYEEAFGIDAIEVANVRHTIGNLYNQLGKFEAALRHFGEALKVFRDKEGSKSLNVANSLFQIGRIYDSFGRREKSLKCFEESLDIRKEMLGDDHLDVLAAQRFVKQISKKINFPQ